jgi:hypothetical protein
VAPVAPWPCAGARVVVRAAAGLAVSHPDWCGRVPLVQAIASRQRIIRPTDPLVMCGRQTASASPSEASRNN